MIQDDFREIRNSIDDMCQFLIKQQERIESPNKIPGVLEQFFDRAFSTLVSDAQQIASMGSQALDRGDLSPGQFAALKTSLAKLEFQLRLFGR